MLDRLLANNKINPAEINSLTRLAIVGKSGMGALTYKMCFNVFAHNRDDHSKNFSFLYDENEKRWILPPAYDLTCSNSLGGEHATCVNGNGRNPGMDDILKVAENIGIKEPKAKNIAFDVKNAVESFGLVPK